MKHFVCPEIYAAAGKVDGYLLVANGRIAAIEPGPVPAALAGVERIDLPNARLIPGLIDLHIHGAGGWPVEGADADGLCQLARYLAAFGVTGFLPTASAYPLAELEALARATRTAMAAGSRADYRPLTDDDRPWTTGHDDGASFIRTATSDGAAILGLHLEGPFLNPAQKGAMNINHFRSPSIPDMERLLQAGGGAVRRVTLAPELPGALELIRYLADRGVAVAGGHTDATFAETQAGIEAGVRIANHTYNAMRGLHHREPGALGAYLVDDRVTCEVICDLRHVHPGALALLLRAVGPERMALISDAIPAAGMTPGHYRLYGRDLYIDEEGFSKLANGTIAGSTKLMLDGLRNLVEQMGLPWEAAVRMAALIPAGLIGLADRKGSLAVGKDADMVAIGPGWQVEWTLVEGRVAWRPGDTAPALNPEFAAARQ